MVDEDAASSGAEFPELKPVWNDGDSGHVHKEEDCTIPEWNS
jgi:hypothetical protein